MKNKNYFEIAIIGAIIENFIKSGINARRIGVVTTTQDQLTILQRDLNFYTVRVYLIDKLQGVSKDVLIISSVKHNRKH